MSYAPQYPYGPERPLKRKRGRTVTIVALVFAVLVALCTGLGLTIANSADTDQAGRRIATIAEPTPAPSSDAAPATAEAARSEKPGYSAGSWKVGTEVKVGTYVTHVPEDSLIGCYWARLRDFDGDVNSIISNDIIAPGGRGRFVVKKTDHGVELTGDCVWTRED
jgi:hypothetical protein